ncbi:hypothetical protein D9758_017271 [Tetrapyrgos nigripes]|uniref:F-box domain-containing protein n=1 Tax=Tetrapyrgos nigripes TaxID=182062 RepID=A0A8H5FGH9_9AGAR|nr:hypothetical protein D9758_017271 [Tetrapyrgos nigripes]
MPVLRPISPFDRVPTEVLNNIFLFTTERNENQYVHHYAEFIMPLTISHTCTRWRSIALSDGFLWTNLDITDFSEIAIYRTHAWLSRSKNRPLSILMDFRDDEWDWDGKDRHHFTGRHMRVFLELLLPHVERWKSFRIYTDTWEPIHTFLSFTNELAMVPSSLQTLALLRCNAYFATEGETFQPDDLKEPIPLFGGRPVQHLREVSLVGVHVDWVESPIRNLRKLEFKYHAYDVMPSLQEFMDILSSCPNLENLAILGWGPQLSKDDFTENYVDFPDDKRLSGSPFVLKNLLTFHFGFTNVQYGLKLLSLFRLPSIKRLDLEDVSTIADPLGHGDASPILDWLSSADDKADADDDSVSSASSSPGVPVKSRRCTLPLMNVERLGLSGLSSSEPIFFRFLRAFQSLKKISLSNADPNLLLALAPQNPPQPVQPGSEGTEKTLEDSCGMLRRTLVSLATVRSRVAPCPNLVDIASRRIEGSQLSALVAKRAQADSGVQPVQKVHIEPTPPLDDDEDREELDDDDEEVDTSFDDSFSSAGISEADIQAIEECGAMVLITPGAIDDD